MPNYSRSNRDKTRKKTRYSSDSDSEREKSRRYREKSTKTVVRRSRERSSKDTKSKSRRKRYSSSSSSSSSTSSRSSSKSSRKSHSSSGPTTSRASSKNFDHITKFEITDLYKEEDKGNIINAIDADSFKQESFQSKKKIVVDLKKGDLKITESLGGGEAEEESLIHPNFLGDEEMKVDKWIKKLQIYRNS